MRRTITNLWVVWAFLLLWVFFPITLKAQESKLLNTRGQETGADQCPLCGQSWPGWSNPNISIPETLPTPKNQVWVSKLRQAVRMAKLAKAQDEANQKKFNITIPYLQIIPQLDRQISWINKLFSAYGLPLNEKPSPIKTPDSILQALQEGKKLQADLAKQYEWLLNHAEDNDTKRVLNAILTQTKIGIVLFDHVIRLFKVEGTIYFQSL